MTGAFYLGDFGAQVGQVLRAPRAGQYPGQIQHLDAGQGLMKHGFSARQVVIVRASVSAAPGAGQFIVFKEAFAEFEWRGECRGRPEVNSGTLGCKRCSIPLLAACGTRYT